MVINCSVLQCKSKQIVGSNIKFHKFPANTQMLTKWLKALKVKSNKLSKYAKVCSLHFKDDDYKPTIYQGYTKRYLKSNAVPSDHLPNISIRSQVSAIRNVVGDNDGHVFKSDTKQAVESMSEEPISDTIILKPKSIPSRNIPRKPMKHLVLLPEPDIYQEPLAPPPIIIPKIEKVDTTIQTDKQLVCDGATQTDSVPTPTETMGYDELSADDFYFFTGLNLPSFQELAEYLDIDNKSNKYTKHMSNYDQLILTLIKLRHKFEFIILAKMYGIHRIIVHEVFVLWINVMFDQFRKTDLWTIRDKNNSDYTAIVHCCEIPCQSNNSKFHTILKSERSKRLTIKYLVATDEQGTVIFCSTKLFGGSIPDRQVITQSGILSKLKTGDKILSEFNFGINDLMNPNGIIFQQPHECSDVDKGRAYIKRIAAMANHFGILKGVFPAILMPYAAIIIYVTNALINFISETEN